MCEINLVEPLSIAAYRRAAGLSQADLAARIGLTRQTLGDRERGRIAWRLVDVARAAQALGVPLESLLVGQGIDPKLLTASAASALDQAKPRVTNWPPTTAIPKGHSVGHDGRVYALDREELRHRREDVLERLQAGQDLATISEETGCSLRRVRDDVKWLDLNGYLQGLRTVASTVVNNVATTVEVGEPATALAGAA